MVCVWICEDVGVKMCESGIVTVWMWVLCGCGIGIYMYE